MKKRFAMMIAGALVAALLAGSAALSLGLLGATTASAGGDRMAPRIRTIERTVTVHKKSKAQPGAVTYAIATPGNSRVSGSESESEFEDEFEDESEDEFESAEGSSDSHGESGGFDDD